MNQLGNVIITGGEAQPVQQSPSIIQNVIVSSSSGGSSTDVACESILGFRTVLPVSSVTGDDSDATYPFNNCLDYRDNTQYSPNATSGSVTIEFTQALSTDIDYIGIGIHNAQSAGLTGTLEVLVDGAWKEVVVINPIGDNKTITEYFEPENCNKQRLTLNFTNKLFIGNIYIGKAWVFDKTPNLGFTPAQTNNLDQSVGFRSQTNQFMMGRRVSRGYGQKGQFDFIPWQGESSLNQEYVEYMNHVKDNKPLFMLWNRSIKQSFFGRHANPNNLQPPSYSTSNHGTFFFDFVGFD